MTLFPRRSAAIFPPWRFRPRCEALEDRTAPVAGQLDPTFGNGGLITTSIRFQPRAEVALADGQYLAAGTTDGIHQTDFALARFNADGSLDKTFGSGGYASLDFNDSQDFGSGLLVQGDGKIIVFGRSNVQTGSTFVWRFGLARFNADGSLDTAFGSNGKVLFNIDLHSNNNDFADVSTAVLQSDGKILVLGVRLDTNNLDQLTLARLNADGSLDTTYGAAGFAEPGVPIIGSTAATVLGDGRILILSRNSGSQSGTFVMVKADGTLDPTFGAGGTVLLTGINPSAFAVQGDGKIVAIGASGGFILFSQQLTVERLNADGTADATFGVGGRVVTNNRPSIASAILVQPNGKILVGGYVADPTGALQPPYEFALVRYNTDGTLDTDFGVVGRVVTPTGTGAKINALALQADGKIVAIGPPAGPTTGDFYLNGGLTFARYDGTGARIHYFATGAGSGGGPHVKVFDAATEQLKFSFFAFNPTFTGGVRVAVGDVNGDGVDEIVCAAGPGGGPDVRIFDGTDGHLLREFMAYDLTFTGGVYVAVGDVNGDGHADIVTGAGGGGGPHVKVIDGATGGLMDQFMAYDSTFRGGVRVAAGDVNGDALADIVTGAGPGGGPHVEAFNEGFAFGQTPTTPTTRFQLFSAMAFDSTYTGGVFVAAGDVNGDGNAEIIVSQGQGGDAKVRVIRASDSQVLAESSAFGMLTADGAHVAVVDRMSNGRDEVLVGADKVSTKVRTLNGATLAFESEFTAYDPAFQGGVFVG